MQFNIIDIFVLAVIAIGAARGLLRGLSRELADLFRIAGALLLATLLHGHLAVILVEKTRLSEFAAALVAFLIILLVAFLLLTMLHMLLSKFMQFAFKGLLERVGGLLAGALKGAVFAMVIVLLLSFWPHPAVERAVEQDSVCGRWVVAAYPGVQERLAERYPLWREFEQSLTNSVPEVLRPDEDDLQDPENEHNMLFDQRVGDGGAD
jgi:membrane protein required for colicin V production